MRTWTWIPLSSLGACALLLATRSGGPIDAGTALRLEVPELVERADVVLEGRVAALRVLEEDAGRIETEYVLAVERTYFGDPRPERVVRFPGGVLPDGRGLVLPGLPRLAPGEDVLLFLSAPSAAGLRMPVGLAQGKFRIETDADGVRTLVRDQGMVTLANLATGEVRETGNYARRDYAEVVAEIHAAVEKRLSTGGAGRDDR